MPRVAKQEKRTNSTAATRIIGCRVTPVEVMATAVKEMKGHRKGDTPQLSKRYRLLIHRGEILITENKSASYRAERGLPWKDGTYQCSVCLTEEDVVLPAEPCGHSLCIGCIRILVGDQCPICRGQLSNPQENLFRGGDYGQDAMKAEHPPNITSHAKH